MGNIQAEMQPKKKLDKQRIYRLFGINMVNEGDGYEIDSGHFKLQMDTENETQMESTSSSSRFVVNLPPLSLNSGRLGNPGTVADLHQRCHDMLPQTFEGFRLNISRNLTNNVAIGHALQMGKKSQLTSCQFNASYMGERLHELSHEAYPMLIGEMDAKGNLTATFMHFITPSLRTKFTATILDSVLNNSRLHLDYFGNNFTCSCVLSNIDVQQEMGVFVASYLQQVITIHRTK